ncbi:MAG: hypothetical protein ACMV0K_11180 [Sulfurospirillum sp.]
MKRWGYIISLSVAVVLSGCALTELSSGVNQTGVKEYRLVNKLLKDDVAGSQPKSNYVEVDSEYIYAENTDTVKVTLTNIAQKLMGGGATGYDAIITDFMMSANDNMYKPIKCDAPVSNGSFNTKSRVENSLSCYFDKKVFSNLMEIKQFSYRINFSQPNAGDLNTLKYALNDPTTILYANLKELMRLGYTYDQAIFILWSRMPAKNFRAEVVHNSKDKKENLQKFAQCVQTNWKLPMEVMLASMEDIHMYTMSKNQ